MMLTALLSVLLIRISYPFTPEPAPVPYCRPDQRYDVASFPPRCLFCPLVVPNQVALSLIPMQARVRRPMSKFSPGLPQNETCGCWRAPTNLSIDMAVNSSSWIVSGMAFSSTSKGQWLKDVGVQASGDNITFIDLGNYTAQNSTDAMMLFFSYPIRARYFRISIYRYANHYATPGFTFAAKAFVATTQPFTCKCPLLSTGECCPYANMTVRNDSCEWCIDPTQISTVVIDGCGRCRAGTFEYMGRCYYSTQRSAINNLRITAPQSNGVSWTVDVNVSTDARSLAALYLTSSNAPCASAELLCPGYVPILMPWSLVDGKVIPLNAPVVSDQYIQFDRGRYTLNMTQPTIRSWASCMDSVCTGYIGALFVTAVQGASTVQDLKRKLVFETGITSFIMSGSGSPSTALAHMDMHYFASTDTWAVRVTMPWEGVYLQWDQDRTEYIQGPGNNFFTLQRPPPTNWTSLRASDPLNITTLKLLQPVSTVIHGATDQIRYDGILVKIQYGLGLHDAPSPGDSEQIMLITAVSPLPRRWP